MTRKLWILGTVAILGATAVFASGSKMHSVSACDDGNKVAATQSCCAKNSAKSASADAKQIHNSMIKSAVVAPGAAPILNVAAFGAMTASGKHAGGDCNWCDGAGASAANCAGMSAAECAAKMSSGECTAHAGMQNAATKSCPFMEQQNAAVTADMKSDCSQSANAAMTSKEHAGCSGSMATTAAMHDCSSQAAHAAAGAACDQSAKTASAGGSCCAEKAVQTASGDEKCSTSKTASLKGVIDEMPYRENKRVTLAGAYACGHCNLDKTEDCAPMLKTADGKIYPLLETARASELKNTDGKSIQVSGTVKKVDGVKFLDVKSYRVM